MTLFALAGLSLAILCFVLSIVILYFARNKTHRIWALFNVVVALWGFGTFLVGVSRTPEEALHNWRLTYLPCTFISILFYHLVCSFCQIDSKRMLRFSYFQGFVFLPFIYFSDFFIKEHILIFPYIYYHKATVLFTIWLAVWIVITLTSFYRLGLFTKHSLGIKRIQSLYLFWGMVLGFSGGTTSVIPSYGVPVYPAFHFTICIYAALMTYALFKYRMMDISLVITRTGIFIAVYSIVLGIPFALAFTLKDFFEIFLNENWWVIPLVVSTILATLGPYFYLFIQRKTEDKLLQEQRAYQSTLRQASLGMGRIKDLKKLLNLIVHIVTRAVKLEHCSIYLLQEDTGKFVLKASKGKRIEDSALSIIPVDSALVKFFKEKQEPLVYEEVKQKSQDYQDYDLIQIESIMRMFDSALAVPSFIEDRLIAIVVLGKKKSGKLYSQDDLAVFSILANQSALAIENAQFYEDVKKTHEQLFKAEKMATIGTMADGLSHQINNRLHAMGFIAGDALDTIKIKNTDKLLPEAREVLNELGHSFERIQDNVKRGGEIVEGLLKYTRKGEEGFSPLDLGKLLDASFEMAQFKIKLNEIDIKRNFNDSIAKIQGNFTQLQEVFFNIIDNSYDAMMQRKTELKEAGYKPTLEISAEKKGKNLEVTFRDNGMGVKKEDQNKLFAPFFTTKLSSKKGTGLGLYVIRRIIEENHGGKVIFTSEYKQGAQTVVLLPVVSLEKEN